MVIFIRCYDYYYYRGRGIETVSTKIIRKIIIDYYYYRGRGIETHLPEHTHDPDKKITTTTAGAVLRLEDVQISLAFKCDYYYYRGRGIETILFNTFFMI